MKKIIILSILTTFTFMSLNSFKTLGTATGCFFLGNNEGCSPDFAACQPVWLRKGEKAKAGMITARFENRDGEIIIIMPVSDILKTLNLKDAKKLTTFKFHSDFPMPDDVCKLLGVKKGTIFSKGDYPAKLSATDGMIAYGNMCCRPR